MKQNRIDDSYTETRQRLKREISRNALGSLRVDRSKNRFCWVTFWSAASAIAVMFSNCKSEPPRNEKKTVAPVIKPAITPRETKRVLLLGKIVNLVTFRSEGNVYPIIPDVELNDAANDWGLNYTSYGHIEAYRLSDHTLLWSYHPPVPCSRFVLSTPRVYAICHDSLHSYDTQSGYEQLIVGRNQRHFRFDISPKDLSSVKVQNEDSCDVDNYEIHDNFLVTLHTCERDGRIKLIDRTTGHLLQQKIIPEFKRTIRSQIIATPKDRLCVYGITSSGPIQRRFRYKFGCYNWKLESIWSRQFDFPTQPGDGYFVEQQLGPNYLVLDDDNGSTLGNGLIVRWRDGTVVSFDNHTLATIDDDQGERIEEPRVLELISAPANLHQKRNTFAYHKAIVQSTDTSYFVLLVGRPSSLVEISRSTLAIRYNIPLKLEGPYELSVLHGYLVIRYSNLEAVGGTIHDPKTGTILYSDERKRR